jgi:opacity protein-like surface antigen
MKRMAILAALITLISMDAFAQDVAPKSSLAARSGYVSLGLGGGFMVDPDMTAGTLNLDYYITDEVSVGPYFHIGGAGRNSYWGVSGQAKFSSPLAGSSSIRPYGALGIGFIELDFEDRDDRETTYYFPVSGGLEFELTDMLSFDAGAVFNITEDTFAGLTIGLRVLL